MDYNFADRAYDVPSSGIALMMRYAANYPGCVSLGQGTPLFPTPQFIYDYVQDQARKDPGVGQYSLSPLENQLKELIATQMREIYGFTPKPEELALSVGGAGGLFATFMTLINPGDEVIYFDPSYPIHLSQLAIAQAKITYVSLVEDSGWHLDIPKLQAAVSEKTKMIVLTNPNNPTGTVMTKDEIMAIAELVKKYNLYLVLDEAYQFLSYSGEVFSPASLSELKDNIILVKSFSKEFAMTGWRLGYIFANSELIKKINNNVNLYTCINPPTITMHAAIAALSDPRGKQATQDFIKLFTESRKLACERMTRLNKLFSFTPPEGAFYIFARLNTFPELSALEFCQKLVAEAGVITIPGDSSGPSGLRHVRMSFAAAPEKISIAFDRIDSFANKYNL